MDQTATRIHRLPHTVFENIENRFTNNYAVERNTEVIQYVDDLLIACTDCDVCLEDTRTLLCALAEKGHKVSLAKMQLCQQ